MKKRLSKDSRHSKYFKFKSDFKNLKVDPDRIHNIIYIVNTRYEKLSPMNCSKNILATKSNIDTEIESIRLKALSPDPSFSRFLSDMSTPSPHRLQLPSLNSSPSKKLKFRKISFPRFENRLENNYSKVTLSPLSNIESKRLEKIDSIIMDCKGVSHEFPFDSSKSEKKIRINNEYCSNVVKILNGYSFEQKIVERCIEHVKEDEIDQSDNLRIAKALKRSKKIWKQNHLSFIKTIDRMVNSIPLKKAV